MSLAALVGIVIAAAIVTAAVLAGTRNALPGWPARIARWIAFALVVGVVVTLIPQAPREAGWFALVLFGIPVVASGGALLADYAGRRPAPVTWLAGGVMLAWSLLTGLGWGFYFLAPSLVMLVGAVLATPGRHADMSTAQPADQRPRATST